MMEFPSTDWRERKWDESEAIKRAPVKTNWNLVPDGIRHTFTHFHLELAVLAGCVQNKGTRGEIWALPNDFSDYALPSVMKKVINHVTRSAYQGHQKG